MGMFDAEAPCREPPFRVNRVTRNRSLRSLFSSTTLAAILLTLFAVAIAVATFVEVRHGATGAQAVVFKARWFEAILGLLTVNLAFLLVKHFPFRWRRSGFFLVHFAVIVILVAAFITRYFGYEGSMPIREGMATDYIYSLQDYIGLRDGDADAAFPVRLYKPGRQGIDRRLDLGDREYRVRVLDFWPRYEERFVPGDGGLPVLQLVLGTAAGVREVTLDTERSERLGEVGLRLVSGELPTVEAAAPLGEILAHLEGTTHRLPVPESVPYTVERAGWTFRFTEWQADFKVGAEGDDPAADLRLLNPMVRLETTDPAGRADERVLFAYHPDFGPGHAGGRQELPGPDLVYHLERGVVFAADGEGGLLARASLALSEIDLDSMEEQREIPAGQDFAVEIDAVYRDPATGLSFVPRRFISSALRAPFASEDANRPSAVRLRVTGPDGDTAEVRLVHRPGAGDEVRIGGRRLTATFGPRRIPLPYSLHLDDFEMQTYPGSDNPAAYRSHVRLVDEELGIDGQPVLIYMNHPLVHRGSRHYQASYDQDRRGTILSVNHDPGTLPTYVGYTLITLGFLISLGTRLLRPRPRPRGDAGGGTS